MRLTWPHSRIDAAEMGLQRADGGLQRRDRGHGVGATVVGPDRHRHQHGQGGGAAVHVGAPVPGLQQRLGLSEVGVASRDRRRRPRRSSGPCPSGGCRPGRTLGPERLGADPRSAPKVSSARCRLVMLVWMPMVGEKSAGRMIAGPVGRNGVLLELNTRPDSGFRFGVLANGGSPRRISLSGRRAGFRSSGPLLSAPGTGHCRHSRSRRFVGVDVVEAGQGLQAHGVQPFGPVCALSIR